MEGLGKYGSSGEEYEDSEEEEGVEAKSPPPFETLTAFVPVSPAFPTTNSYPTSFDTYKAVAVNSVGNSNSEQQQEVNKNEKEQIKNKREKKKSKKDKKKKDKTSLDSVDEFVAKKKIPIANQVDLGGHTKAIVALSIEPTGNRVVTGSLDYSVKLFDFGGMDSRHRSFKTFEPEESHMVVAISHSPSGDRFIIATGSAQPILFDRDGNEVIKFVKGDMYLRDLSNTKGHTMEVTGLQWHPHDKNMILTSSLDGSLRIWDLLGEALFGNLTCKHVLKIRGATGVARVGATSCCYSPTGQRIIGGASDGTIHVWNERKVYGRADIHIKLENTLDQPICSVKIALDNNLLACRCSNGVIGVWDLKTYRTPKKILVDVLNDYPTANVEFSPDFSLLCCGTSPIKGDPESKSRLNFYDINSNSSEPNMSIAIAPGASVVMVKWHVATNQIYCTTSNGFVRVLFDPLFSKKGALLSAFKAPKREKDPTDYAVVGEIINPHALPMYRSENDHAKRKREKDHLNNPTVTKIPIKPADHGPGARINTSFFFTDFVMKGRTVDKTRTEDPREALLKVDAEARANPMFLGKAYESSQPKPVLYEMTFEQEQDEFRKKQKDSIDITKPKK